MPYQYVWVSDLAGEIATLTFYVMTGFYFRPHAENPYFALQDDEISLQVCALGLKAYYIPAAFHDSRQHITHLQYCQNMCAFTCESALI